MNIDIYLDTSLLIVSDYISVSVIPGASIPLSTVMPKNYSKGHFIGKAFYY